MENGMAKYRVHFIATSSTGGKVTSTVDVEAESEHVAMQLAEGKWRAGRPDNSNYAFMITKVGRP